MRGNTPPTTRSPPHRSRLTGKPPNLQPVTVSEEERGGRDQKNREAPDCRPPPTARHASQPRSRSTSHPPQQQDAVHRELRPGTGKGARAGAGPLRRTARPAAGPVRAPPLLKFQISKCVSWEGPGTEGNRILKWFYLVFPQMVNLLFSSFFGVNGFVRKKALVAEKTHVLSCATDNGVSTIIGKVEVEFGA